MAEHEDPQDATPVPAPPYETSPSATGLVEGDADEAEPAPPDPDLRS